MIITEEFILLNFPKTGSTFVRSVLKQIYERRSARRSIAAKAARALLRPNRRPIQEHHFPNLHTIVAGDHPIKDQHGCFDQVPAKYRHLPVITIARNPLDRYVSMYRFPWWATHPCAPLPELRRLFPDFPDLTFAEFVDYHSYRNRPLVEKYGIADQIGPHTLQFAIMHFHSHELVLRGWNSHYVASGAYLSDLPRMEFLRNEHLNEDLFQALARYGYSEDELEFVRSSEPIQPPEGTRRSPDEHWQTFYDEDTRQRVLDEEAALFKIYADFGINY